VGTQLSHPLQAIALEVVQDALHGAPRDVGQLGDAFMRLAVGFQPEHFHPPLHARIGVLKALLNDRFQLLVRKLKPAHPCDSAKC
jgi:hypothetical protein